MRIFSVVVAAIVVEGEEDNHQARQRLLCPLTLNFVATVDSKGLEEVEEANQ